METVEITAIPTIFSLIRFEYTFSHLLSTVLGRISILNLTVSFASFTFHPPPSSDPWSLIRRVYVCAYGIHSFLEGALIYLLHRARGGEGGGGGKAYIVELL